MPRIHGPREGLLCPIRHGHFQASRACAISRSKPSDGELRAHFTGRFLGLVTLDRVVRTLAGRAAELREEPMITLAEPLRIRARVGGMQIEAVAESAAPHRLGGLRVYPVGSTFYDDRIAAPSTRTRVSRQLASPASPRRPSASLA